VDRRRLSTQAIMTGLHRRTRTASAALSTTDGRWALVSTSITALVAGSMAWLAAGAMLPLHSSARQAPTTFLPYRLFTQLVQAGSNLVSGDTPRRVTPLPAKPDNTLGDEDNGDDGNSTPGVETRTLTLQSGDTLPPVLTNAGVTSADTAAAVQALVKVYDVTNMRAGTTIKLTFEAAPPKPAVPEKPAPLPVVKYGLPPSITPGGDEDTDANGDVTPTDTPVGRLLSIAFSPSVEHDVTVSRNADNSFTASDVVKQLVEHTHRAGATLDGSLYLAGVQAGIPAGILVDMIKLFAYKVDFQRDLKPGDSFEVYYNYYFTADGQPAREGNIDYAVIRTGGREIAVYRYQPDPNQAAEYYNAHGESLKGMLMKTPVDGARISSGFGMRFHPVLGYSRMHKGIDFAVPVGTPVMASGTGTVKMAGWSNGYGNYMRVDMGNGYGFAYGHLSRFAPGMHVGSSVHQGEVVAYSGNTGLSTGPHLHYETLVGGTQVNPLTLKIAQGRVLSGNDLRDFLIARLHTDAVLASTPLEAKVADAATDLRQAKAR
jgi:murein DD-endopeptidase MepM/ murein hydrolase activator NlpD